MKQLSRLEEAKYLLQIGFVHNCTNKINEIINKTQRLNKLIRLADRSEAGWLTVQN